MILVQKPNDWLPYNPPPPDEGVVVRVDGRGDEGPAPVDAGAKLLHVIDADGGEVVEPVQRVDELGDLFLRDHLLQDVPLPHDARAGLLDQLGLAPLGLLVRRGRGGLGRGGGGHLGLHLGPARVQLLAVGVVPARGLRPAEGIC